MLGRVQAVVRGCALEEFRRSAPKSRLRCSVRLRLAGSMIAAILWRAFLKRSGSAGCKMGRGGRGVPGAGALYGERLRLALKSCIFRGIELETHAQTFRRRGLPARTGALGTP